MPGAFDPSKYANKAINVDTVKKLKEVFDVFDYDGSGQISIDEMINTIKALGIESQAEQILSVISASGHEGDMDFGQFLNIFGFSQEAPTESSLAQLYESFDLNHQGFFGPEEFEKVANSVGENLSAAEVDQIIQYADKDRDGGVTLEEFIATVTRQYPKV